MAKKHVIGVRFTDEEREALQAAADDKSMSWSALIRMIVTEWLRRNRWLAPPVTTVSYRRKKR